MRTRRSARAGLARRLRAAGVWPAVRRWRKRVQRLQACIASGVGCGARTCFSSSVDKWCSVSVSAVIVGSAAPRGSATRGNAARGSARQRLQPEPTISPTQAGVFPARRQPRAAEARTAVRHGACRHTRRASQRREPGAWRNWAQPRGAIPRGGAKVASLPRCCGAQRAQRGKGRHAQPQRVACGPAGRGGVLRAGRGTWRQGRRGSSSAAAPRADYAHRLLRRMHAVFRLAVHRARAQPQAGTSPHRLGACAAAAAPHAALTRPRAARWACPAPSRACWRATKTGCRGAARAACGAPRCLPGLRARASRAA